MNINLNKIVFDLFVLYIIRLVESIFYLSYKIFILKKINYKTDIEKK